MKLKETIIPVVSDNVNTTKVNVTIVNNIIKITSKGNIPFSGDVVNYLKDKFGEDICDCEFDDNTCCVIYIKPLKEELIAMVEPICESIPVVEFGFLSTYYEIEED